MNKNSILIVFVAAITVLGIIIIFELVPIIGSTAEASIVVGGNPIQATGILTFTGNVTSGELVNISSYTFEYTNTGEVSSNRIPVYIPYNSTGKGTAIVSLITAIQNNASVSSIVTVST